MGVNEASPGELEKSCGGDVVADVVNEVQAVGLTVFCSVSDAMLNGLGNAMYLDFLAFFIQAAANVAAPGASRRYSWQVRCVQHPSGQQCRQPHRGGR